MNNPRTVKIYLTSGSFIRGVAEYDIINEFIDKLNDADESEIVTLEAGTHEIKVMKSDFSAVAIRPPRNGDDDYEDEEPRGRRRR